jgi:hypothetical protein
MWSVQYKIAERSGSGSLAVTYFTSDSPALRAGVIGGRELDMQSDY